MSLTRRIARPLLGSYFIYSGFNTVRNPSQTADSSAPVFEQAQNALPESQFVPSTPTTWARALGGAQLGGGALLAIGRLPRVSALTLASTVAATTPTENQFWAESDPAARHEATVHFLKNLSLIGGLVIAGFDTDGKPGVVWRTKRVGRRASDKASEVVAAVKPGAAEASHGLTEHAEQLASAAKDAAEQVGPRLERARGVVQERALEVAEKAAPQVAHARGVAEQRASQATEKAAPIVSSLAESAATKAAELSVGSGGQGRRIA